MNHYVYEITNLANGKKYIGKRSCKCSIEDDTYMGSGYLIKRAITKYGIENFKKEILEVCENEEDAYTLEKQYIKSVKAWDNDEYYNIDGGGRGVGCGESHPMYQKNVWSLMKNPDKAKKKISQSMKGRKQSKEHIAKKARSSRRVVCINNGLLLDSIKEASLYVNCSKGGISSVCSGERLSAGKLINGECAIWMYYDEYVKLNQIDVDNIIKDVKKHKENITSHIKKKCSKSVICLNNLDIMESISDASRKYNIDIGSISKCCSGKRRFAGVINGEKGEWMYYDDYLKLDYQ